MLAFAVTATLGLSMAAPAMAAPERNPRVLTFTVTCGSDTWDVTTTGEIGWPVEASPGTTPAILTGGTFSRTYDDGTVVTATVAPPLGLAGKVQTCRIEGPLEPIGYHTVVDPAYVLFPGS